MSPAPARHEHLCEKCGKVFTSMMRLQHHLAAEHAVRTMRDIRTTRHLRQVAKGGAR